jgi:hypothetical protein
MVEGKVAHTVAPSLDKRKRHMGVTDYEASWSVGCGDLAELLTGKTLRVVMPEFNGEWDLSQLVPSFEKMFGVASKKIIAGTAPECAPPATTPPPEATHPPPPPPGAANFLQPRSSALTLRSSGRGKSAAPLSSSIVRRTSEHQ